MTKRTNTADAGKGFIERLQEQNPWLYQFGGHVVPGDAAMIEAFIEDELRALKERCKAAAANSLLSRDATLQAIDDVEI